jgi:hypothetical protein
MELKGKALKPSANRTQSQVPPIARRSAHGKKEKSRSRPAPQRTSKNAIVAQTSSISTPLAELKLSSRKTIAESAVEEAERLLLLPPSDRFIGSGTARVRFSHYNKPFPVHNGVLKWSAIDDEYCLSFVYKGNFVRDLFPRIPNGQSEGRRPVRRDDIGVYFLDLQAGAEYDLVVQEDPVAGIGAEGLRLREAPLAARELGALRDGQSAAVLSKNTAVKTLTDELKGMNPDDLGSAKARDLIERRDIEDILFSG